MKKMYIRTDMNDSIATGHVMRCLAIADVARIQGIESIFILADEQAVELLSKREYEYIVLGTKWDELNNEISKICKVIEEWNIEKLLIDTYQVTYEYLEALTKLTYTIYLDDINAFCYPVNTIICYANYWEKFDYYTRYCSALEQKKIKAMPQFLLGCKYVPLRHEFSDLPQKAVNREIRKILILSGGTDPYNAIDQILEAIELFAYEQIDVICGQYHKNKPLLKKKYEKYSMVHINSSVNNLIDYMERADLAISAGGTTLYELSATGTPVITFYFADNQYDNVMQFEKDNIAVCLGDLRRENNINSIQEFILKYTKDERIRRSNLQQCLVDGNGAMRIVKKIFEEEEII